MADRPPSYLQGISKDFLGWARRGGRLIQPVSSDSHRQGQRVPLACPLPSGSNINSLALKRGRDLEMVRETAGIWRVCLRGKVQHGHERKTMRGREEGTWERRGSLNHRKGASACFGGWGKRRLQAPELHLHFEGTPVYIWGLLFAQHRRASPMARASQSQG